MVDATRSACINHPGIEATGRCKQCGRPMCDACRIVGPTGHFCSDPCRRNHEVFMQRAAQLETKARGRFGPRLRSAFGGLIVLLVVAAVTLGVGKFFHVPVLQDIADWLLGLAGR